jgi:nucleoside-diphosphate-sugar epimerase
MKRVLLTGATGFIGRHCVPVLLRHGYEVHVISRQAQLNSVAGLYEHQADLLDASALAAVMRQMSPTHLLHLAWNPVSPGWASETGEASLPWIQASLRLARLFAELGGQRAVLAGTCAEYDWNYGQCLEDSTPTRPATAYGRGKHALQVALEEYCRRNPLSHAWARIFFVYGPHEHPQRLVASVIRSLLRRKPARCSHGNQIRDYLYVGDVAQALVTLLGSEVKGAVNVGSGKPLRLRDLVMRIAEKLGLSDLVQFGVLPPGPLEARAVVADIRRLTQAAGWQPRYDLDGGLDETILWWAERNVTECSAAEASD